MKLIVKIIIPFLIFGMFSCKGKKADKTATKTEQTVKTESKTISNTSGTKIFEIDKMNSSIMWTGSKKIGSDSHTGTINVSQGTLNVGKDGLVGGRFLIDMNSITNTDQNPGEGKEDLESHLKTGDFFETGKFPTGLFEITSVNAVSGNDQITHNIVGNLTLKGITRSISIPANVAIMGDKITAVTPAFEINRTEFGIKFHSGLLATPKNKIINDEIKLVINLAGSAK